MLIDSNEVAVMLNVQARTIKMWRYHKKGPPWYRIHGGRIRYKRDEVIRWIEEQEYVNYRSRD